MLSDPKRHTSLPAACHVPATAHVAYVLADNTLKQLAMTVCLCVCVCVSRTGARRSSTSLFLEAGDTRTNSNSEEGSAEGALTRVRVAALGCIAAVCSCKGALAAVKAHTWGLAQVSTRNVHCFRTLSQALRRVCACTP